MNKELEIPAKYKEIIGTTVTMQGHLFSYRKKIEPTDFEVLGVRFGSATIMNVKQLMETGKSDYEYPTVEYLVKNKSMKQSRWTTGFPVREINLLDKSDEEKHVRKSVTGS